MTPAHRLYSASTSPFALVKLQRKVQTSWSYCLSKIPLRNELSWTHYTLSMSLPREKWRRPSVASLAPCLFPLFSWGQGQLRSRRRLAGRLVLPDSFFVYNFHWWRFSLATNKGEGSCGGRGGRGEVELVLPGHMRCDQIPKLYSLTMSFSAFLCKHGLWTHPFHLNNNFMGFHGCWMWSQM